MPRVVVSGKAMCFTALAPDAFMARNGTTWKTLLAYGPMSHIRSDRMVDTLKRAIRKVLLGSAPSSVNWDDALRRILHGYRCRKVAARLSLFELLYRVLPRMKPGDKEPPFGVTEVRHREMELLQATAMRAM